MILLQTLDLGIVQCLLHIKHQTIHSSVNAVHSCILPIGWVGYDQINSIIAVRRVCYTYRSTRICVDHSIVSYLVAVCRRNDLVLDPVIAINLPVCVCLDVPVLARHAARGG